MKTQVKKKQVNNCFKILTNALVCPIHDAPVSVSIYAGDPTGLIFELCCVLDDCVWNPLFNKDWQELFPNFAREKEANQ